MGRLTLLALAAASMACGGQLRGQVDDGCSTVEPCADAGAASDATSGGPSKDGMASPIDVGAPGDASVDGSLQDVLGPPDDASSDAGGPATEAGLPSTAPCLGGGNVMWLQASPASFWYDGGETLSDAATWAAEAEAYYFQWDGTYVQATAANAGPGNTWTLSFNTWNLDAGLQTGVVYDMAQGGGDLIGYARTCDGTTGLVGQFRVDELTATGENGGIGTLLSYTATFWAQCTNPPDPGAPGVLQGCVHYQH